MEKHTKQVVTYAHAYIGGTSSLCAICESDQQVLDRLPVLGAVQYGAHVGACDGRVPHVNDAQGWSDYANDNGHT